MREKLRGQSPEKGGGGDGKRRKGEKVGQFIHVWTAQAVDNGTEADGRPTALLMEQMKCGFNHPLAFSWYGSRQQACFRDPRTIFQWSRIQYWLWWQKCFLEEQSLCYIGSSWLWNLLLATSLHIFGCTRAHSESDLLLMTTHSSPRPTLSHCYLSWLCVLVYQCTLVEGVLIRMSWKAHMF